MYLFCNQALVGKIAKSKTKVQLKSNGGTMIVSHQATVNQYQNSVCFSKNNITNIVSLSNLRLKYLITYRSNMMVFILHGGYEGKPNIQAIIHQRSLHYFDQRDQGFTFVNTVFDKEEGLCGGCQRSLCHTHLSFSLRIHVGDLKQPYQELSSDSP